DRVSAATEAKKLAEARSDKARAQGNMVEAEEQAAQARRSNLGAVGGYVFDGLVAIVLVLGSAISWLFHFLARVLGVLFYVLGPLALVFSIPKPSDVGARWFHMFCTVLAWPLLSGLLFRISLAIGLDGMTRDGASNAFASILTALLLVCVSVLTPSLASG